MGLDRYHLQPLRRRLPTSLTTHWIMISLGRGSPPTQPNGLLTLIRLRRRSPVVVASTTTTQVDSAGIPIANLRACKHSLWTFSSTTGTRRSRLVTPFLRSSPRLSIEPSLSPYRRRTPESCVTNKSVDKTHSLSSDRSGSHLIRIDGPQEFFSSLDNACFNLRVAIQCDPLVSIFLPKKSDGEGTERTGNMDWRMNCCDIQYVWSGGEIMDMEALATAYSSVQYITTARSEAKSDIRRILETSLVLITVLIILDFS
jgi:hypothetical protein